MIPTAVLTLDDHFRQVPDQEDFVAAGLKEGQAGVTDLLVVNHDHRRLEEGIEVDRLHHEGVHAELVAPEKVPLLPRGRRASGKRREWRP